MTTKQDRRNAIRQRARDCIINLYHNATPDYPRLDTDSPYADRFDDWFADTARYEIEYIASGGYYGKRIMANAINTAQKFRSEKAGDYYVKCQVRETWAERADCGLLTGWRILELACGNKPLSRKLKKAYGKHYPMIRNDALWECITDYGNLYTYGRGGRTLAPSDLIKTGGGSSFNPREDYADDRSISACVELIAIVESFNRYVGQWCKGVPEMWEDYVKEQRAEERAEKQERKACAARGIVTV